MSFTPIDEDDAVVEVVLVVYAGESVDESLEDLTEWLCVTHLEVGAVVETRDVGHGDRLVRTRVVGPRDQVATLAEYLERTGWEDL